MTALVRVQNLNELQQTLEQIAVSLDAISSTLAYIARRMEKEEPE